MNSGLLISRLPRTFWNEIRRKVYFGSIQPSNYEIRARRDRDKNRGGLIEFVKKSLIYKRLKNFEPRKSESFFSEITVSKKKLLYFSIYRPPSYDNLELFLEELASSLSQASESYENTIVRGFQYRRYQQRDRIW